MLAVASPCLLSHLLGFMGSFWAAHFAVASPGLARLSWAVSFVFFPCGRRSLAEEPNKDILGVWKMGMSELVILSDHSMSLVFRVSWGLARGKRR